METVKITKAQKYAKIEAILKDIEHEDSAMLIEFVQSEASALARKAEKAKTKAAEKKSELDELAHEVLAVLTSEPQGREQIAEQIENEDASVSKVGSRLTKLVNLGYAVKSEVSAVSASGKKTTRMAYALAEPEDVEVDE